MRRTFETAHWTVDRDDALKVVRLTRTPTAFVDLSALDVEMRPVHNAIDAARREGFSALIDLRTGPLRSDDAFEKAFERHRLALTTNWPRVAVLVRSAVGKLQVSRHQANDRAQLGVFTDESLALAHLTG